MPVQASQAGNVNYNAALPVSQSFNVTPGSQTITFGAPPAPTYGDPAFQVSATGGPSGNPVTFAASGACTASAATITIVSAGVCTVTASQAGNVDYDAAQASEAITIGMATPSFAGLSSPTIEAGTATTTIGGSIAFGVLIPTGAISVTLNGVTQTAAIQANGSFTSAFATGLLTPTATPYAVAYTYAGDTNSQRRRRRRRRDGGGHHTADHRRPREPDRGSDARGRRRGHLHGSGHARCGQRHRRRELQSRVRLHVLRAGTTTVTCTATDAHGNSASSGFTVTITDHTGPTLTVPANITASATTPSGAVVTFTASASDLVDGSRPVVCTPASGSTFAIGVTTVACTASDTRGNSTSGTFTVTVSRRGAAGPDRRRRIDLPPAPSRTRSISSRRNRATAPTRARSAIG